MKTLKVSLADTRAGLQIYFARRDECSQEKPLGSASPDYKRADPAADTCGLEAEIDRLVSLLRMTMEAGAGIVEGRK